jgi:uncharacterized protein YceH (UPF0502 family)
MHPFASTAEIESTLVDLAEGDEPLVVHLARRPGQKEARWTHLVAGEPEAETAAYVAPAAVPAKPGLGDRIAELEARVAKLEALLDDTL